MSALKEKLFLLAGCIFISGIEVNCILSKTATAPGNDIKKADNAVEQSIKRDYISGIEESGYSHSGYGLSAHSNYGFPEGYEGYGRPEVGKHYIHHPEEYHQHYQDYHKHYDLSYHKALAIKSLLVPLAGVALLGAAAAFVSNPILLQLGVISSSSLGRKKREAISHGLKGNMSEEDRTRLNEIKLLGRFMAQIPEKNIQIQEKRMIANYLTCFGITKENLCLERVACELHTTEGTSMVMEANVLRIVLNEILDNEFVTEDEKGRLKKAIERGKLNFGCGIYECEEMEKRRVDGKRR